MRTGRILALAVSAAVVTPTQAIAAPPGYTQHDADSATLRDADDPADVLLSDGDPLYAGRDVQSTGISDPDDPTKPDRFQFQPWGKRRVQIRSSAIDSGTPVTCGFSWIVFFTTSPETPNWYEILTSDPQAQVFSDAFFVCHEETVGSGSGNRRWVLAYPSDAEECATIEHPTATTWRFTTPADCLATLTTSIKEKGKTTTTTEVGVSAPMQITAVIP